MYKRIVAYSLNSLSKYTLTYTLMSFLLDKIVIK